MVVREPDINDVFFHPGKSLKPEHILGNISVISLKYFSIKIKRCVQKPTFETFNCIFHKKQVKMHSDLKF